MRESSQWTRASSNFDMLACVALCSEGADGIQHAQHIPEQRLHSGSHSPGILLEHQKDGCTAAGWPFFQNSNQLGSFQTFVTRCPSLVASESLEVKRCDWNSSFNAQLNHHKVASRYWEIGAAGLGTGELTELKFAYSKGLARHLKTYIEWTSFEFWSQDFFSNLLLKINIYCATDQPPITWSLRLVIIFKFSVLNFVRSMTCLMSIEQKLCEEKIFQLQSILNVN